MIQLMKGVRLRPDREVFSRTIAPNNFSIVSEAITGVDVRVQLGNDIRDLGGGAFETVAASREGLPEALAWARAR